MKNTRGKWQNLNTTLDYKEPQCISRFNVVHHDNFFVLEGDHSFHYTEGLQAFI